MNLMIDMKQLNILTVLVNQKFKAVLSENLDVL